MLSSCSFFEGYPTDIPFMGRAVGYRGKHLNGGMPLPDNWQQVEILDYKVGHFSFPPPAGYRVLQYVDYVENVSLDLHRELIDDQNDFLDIIKYRRGSDHCSLYGERFTTINGIDVIEVDADCYIWHRGDFKKKYYFIRVGPIVFTFRMLSSEKNFGHNKADFDKFVNYVVNTYLLYPVEEEITPYQHYAYPLNKEDFASFFQPAKTYLAKVQ